MGKADELFEILAGGMGRAMHEPETRTAKERICTRLRDVVAGARKEAEKHEQHAKDAETILKHIENCSEDDPFVWACSRVLI